MSKSGINIDPACITVYQDLKLKKAATYIIYKMSEDYKSVIVESQQKGGSYDEFIAKLPKEECRYAVYDFEFEKPGEGTRNKICFIAWAPDEAPIKKKMVYASTKVAMVKALVGIQAEIQAMEKDEVKYESVIEKVLRV